MAPHADDRVGNRARQLLRLLAPSPERWEFAFRNALICALTALVTQIYEIPDPALSVYVVFFLNKPDRATSLVVNFLMLVVITITIALAIGTAVIVADRPVWRVAAISILSFGLLFLTSASKLRPVGSTIALIVGYALDLLGSTFSGELALRVMLYAWLIIAIPIGVSMVVNLLIAPSPRRLVQRALADRLSLCALMLRTPDQRTRRAFTQCIEEGPGEIPAWLKLAGVEKTSPAKDIAALRQAAESTTAILLLVGMISSNSEAMLPGTLRAAAAELLDAMASILRSDGYPVGITFAAADSEATLSPLARAVVDELREAIVGFAEPPPAAPPAAAEKSAGGFFLPDAFTNSDHVHYALKTTAAAVFCYCLYSLLDWPKIHTSFLTCYIVALTTSAEAVEKLTLRILGCIVGAAAGIAAIVFVMPALTSIDGLLAVVFAGAYLSAWIAGGSPRIAYAGFQIAFAFFLCVIQGSAPAFDMVTARDRVIGILIGDVVSYFVFTSIWPVSITRGIDPALAGLLRHLRTMLSAAGASVRRTAAATALATRGAIEQDLELARYEPGWARPRPGWIQRRLRAVREVAPLIGPLLLCANRSPEYSSEVGHRLGHMMESLGVADSAAGGEARPESAAAGRTLESGIRGLVDRHLRDLEDALAGDNEAGAKAATYAPA
jgi:multidrug resistance protein MdtO